jgi:hypothetical protein
MYMLRQLGKHYQSGDIAEKTIIFLYKMWNVLFDWLLRRIAFLNLDNESNFLIAISSLFHSLSVDGPRKLKVILTQIRCTASFLNHDLHKVHILSSPACSCGAPQEDANHFFFVCTKYYYP